MNTPQISGQVLALYNPFAGRGDAQKRLAEIVAVLRDRFGRCDAEATEGPGTASAQARRAAAAGYAAVVVCGGDGTLAEALQGVAGTATALGVLPMGTGNVVARDLGLAADPVKAARELAEGSVRLLPVGAMEAAGAVQYFLASAGVGLHAALMAVPKVPGAGRFQYYAQGMRLLFGSQRKEFRVEVTGTDGDMAALQCSELIVTRVGSYGGLLKRWRPGGGLMREEFAVTMARTQRRAPVLWFLGQAVVGRMGGDDAEHHAEIATRMARRVVCSALTGEDVPAQADGTLAGALPVAIYAVPNAVRLMLPDGFENG